MRGCPMALKEMARVGGGFTPHCPCQGFCAYYSTDVLIYKGVSNVLRFLMLPGCFGALHNLEFMCFDHLMIRIMVLKSALPHFVKSGSLPISHLLKYDIYCLNIVLQSLPDFIDFPAPGMQVAG